MAPIASELSDELSIIRKEGFVRNRLLCDSAGQTSFRPIQAAFAPVRVPLLQPVGGAGPGRPAPLARLGGLRKQPTTHMEERSTQSALTAACEPSLCRSRVHAAWAAVLCKMVTDALLSYFLESKFQPEKREESGAPGATQQMMESFVGLLSMATLLSPRPRGEEPFRAIWRALQAIGVQAHRMRLFVLLGGLIEKSRSLGTQLRCSGKRVLVVGAGPMGLHAALELRLAGAKVTLLDSRKEFNRVNRLHIWEDYQKLLEDLGAKDLGVKFGTGGYRHVGIADLQFILLKLCLLLGVEVKLGCGFGKKTVRYSRDRSSWVARRPRDGIAAIDAVVFASGKAPAALPVAKRPRAGASAVIQASHGASHTAARFSGSVARREGLVKEGCALGLVFNFKIGNAQQERCWGEFAKAKQFADEGSPLMDAPESENDQDMHASLENCVYYRGPKSHYMIATTSKHSLLKVGVLHYGPAMDGERAVAGCPVDAWQLGRLGPILAARFGMPSLHLLDHKQPCDVFDFSSTERHASSIIFKEGSPTEPLHPLPVCLVGDALMEPFWPTGLGCIRGYMSVLDAVSNLSTWFDTGDQAEVSSRAARAYHQLKTVNQEGGARHPLKPYKYWGVEPDSRYKLHH